MNAGPSTDLERSSVRRGSRGALACAVALAALLAGCTSEGPDTPSPEASHGTPAPETPTEPPSGGPDTFVVTGDAGAEEITLVSHSAVKSHVSEEPTRVDLPAGLTEFKQPLPPPLRRKVTEAVRQHHDGDGLATYAAVVDVGCSPPNGVRIDRTDGGLTLRTDRSSEQINCLVPVTYVLLFAAPPTL